MREGPPASVSAGSGCSSVLAGEMAAGQGRVSQFAHKEREALLVDERETDGTTANVSVVKAGCPA